MSMEIHMNDLLLQQLHGKMAIKIRSIDDVLLAMSWTSHLAEKMGFSLNDQLHLQLVTEEAIMNAIEHNELAHYAFIKVNWQIEEHTFCLSVRQRGTPFRLEVAEETPYSKRGRGLQLIRSIMDHVWIEEKGDNIILHMTKELRSGQNVEA